MVWILNGLVKIDFLESQLMKSFVVVYILKYQELPKPRLWLPSQFAAVPHRTLFKLPHWGLGWYLQIWLPLKKTITFHTMRRNICRSVFSVRLWNIWVNLHSFFFIFLFLSFVVLLNCFLSVFDVYHLFLVVCWFFLSFFPPLCLREYVVTYRPQYTWALIPWFQDEDDPIKSQIKEEFVKVQGQKIRSKWSLPFQTAGFPFALALGSERLLLYMLGCYITAPHFIRVGEAKSRGFSENTYTCSAVEPFLHGARLEVFSSMFRPPLNQLNLTRSHVKEVCLPVVFQVFHIPLDDVNFCRRSVLHCFVSAVTQTLWTIQKQQHRFTLLTVLQGWEKKEMEIFFSNYSRESELARLLLSAEFVWVSLM